MSHTLPKHDEAACEGGPARRTPKLIGWLEHAFRPQHDAIIAFVVNVTAAGTFLEINDRIRWFPSWLPLLVTLALEVVLIATYVRRKTELNQMLGYFMVIVQFFFVLTTVSNLVQKLPQHPELRGSELLGSGALLWFANLLVFTMWYWRFDGGGPHLRDAECPHISFLFPQLLLSHRERRVLEQEHWKPGLIDYLFLAFNTSTALSPADTAVIGRSAKITTMMQSAISLAIVVVVIGRGVNAM